MATISGYDAAFISRKEKAVVEDLKTAFSGYERLIRQINEIRRWMVTLEVAAVGVLISGKLARPTAALLPACIALGAFCILELRERSSMRFNKNEVLDIERLFMISDGQTYANGIAEYEFRDLRLSRLSRGEKVRHLRKATKNLNVWAWYGTWLIIIIAVFSFTVLPIREARAIGRLTHPQPEVPNNVQRRTTPPAPAHHK